MPKRSNRTVYIVLGLLLALVFFVFLLSAKNKYSSASPVQNYHIASPNILKVNGLVLPQPRAIHDFALMADTQHVFNKNSLRGHWTLMFFGFSNCGYVCPTTLAALNKVYMQLKAQLPAFAVPQVVMVSVDPERDTVKRLHEYVQSFNTAFVGARGSLEATAALAQQMSVVFAKVQALPSSNAKGGYMVNHSAEIMLLNPNGDLQAFFSFPPEPPQIVHDYLAVLRAVGARV